MVSRTNISKSSLDNVKTPSTSTIYRLIKKGVLPKVSMKSLRRKGNFKRPSEKRGKFNDRGRTIKKRDKGIYIKNRIWTLGRRYCRIRKI